jgi:threonine/homoserine/homoserine lactone efflux protein
VDNLIALAAATLVLVMIPGPNVALIVANSIRYGIRMGSVTVLGTTVGVALQLATVLLGMAAIIELAADALTWIRWAGVAYLIWLGVSTWREPVEDLSKITAEPAVFWRACIVAAVNPKTLLFNAAFLPQFVPSGGNATMQLAVVSGVFLTVLLLGDMLWALSAGTARQLLEKHAAARNKITGGILVAAAIGLALSRRGS